MKKTFRSMGLVFAVLATAFVCDIAWAQPSDSLFSRDYNVSVTDRSRPEYDSGGLQVGVWTVNPELYVGIEHDNNIFATQTDERDDFIAIITPAFTAQTNWSVHALSVGGDVKRREYFDFGSESVTHLNVFGDGRLDIRRGTFFSAGATYQDLTEPRTSSGAANRAAEPISYDITSGYVKGVHETGRVRLSSALDLASYDYDAAVLNNGAFADQDFRDRDKVAVSGRTAYAISPATAVFADINYVDISYDNLAGAINRNQDGVTLNVGADFEITNLVRGDIGIGYFSRSFDDFGFDEINGLSVNAGLEWFPSTLVTVKLNANRAPQVSSLIASPAYVNTGFDGSIDYELRRNIILSAGGSFLNETYENIDREDDRVSGYIGVHYLFNRNVGLSANLVQSNLSSTGLDRQSDFDKTSFTFGFTLRR